MAAVKMLSYGGLVNGWTWIHHRSGRPIAFAKILDSRSEASSFARGCISAALGVSKMRDVDDVAESINRRRKEAAHSLTSRLI